MDRPEQIAIPMGLCSPSDRLKGICPDSYQEWFRIENLASGSDEGPLDLVIDGMIVDDFMAEMLGIGTSATQVVDAIMTNRGRPLNVWINSEGGLIQDGLGIYNQLLMHDAPVTTIVYGFAMSIASVIAMAGDTRIMAPASALFVHEAHGALNGTSSDHLQEAENLDRLSEQIAGVYRARGDSRRNWRSMMKAGSGPGQGTFILADEALKLGLASRIDTDIVRKPSNLADMARYSGAVGLGEVRGRMNMANLEELPDTIIDNPDSSSTEESTEEAPTLTVRDMERILRDGGISQSQAKMAAPKVLAGLTQRDGADGESTEMADEHGSDVKALYEQFKTLDVLYGAPEPEPA